MQNAGWVRGNILAATIAFIGLLTFGYATGAPAVSGEMKQWHTVTVMFDGPTFSESDSVTFLNYRLAVTFTSGDKSYEIPGFFAADGNAATSGAKSGNKWAVRFCPDAAGTWNYSASFRTGPGVAADLSKSAGAPDTTIDGKSGSFTIGTSDKTGPDLRGQGMLRYVDKHYFRFAGSGRYFLEGGINSPQNLLAYAGFDNTKNVHAFAPHAADWTAQDAAWSGEKGQDQGKGILGAMNYLSSKGINGVCVRVFNRPGATADVFPFVDSGSAPWDNAAALETFDCSKLDQWDIIFEHMTKKGMFVNLCLTQPANQSVFEWAEKTPGSDSAFAASRKVFYREMVARFGHLCALEWNLVEQMTNRNPATAAVDRDLSEKQVKSFASYIRAIDAYRHPIVFGSQFAYNPGLFYQSYMGDPAIEGTSVVDDQNDAFEYPRSLWSSSDAAQKPMVIFQDNVGTGIDPSLDTAFKNVFSWNFKRVNNFWPVLGCGGSGVEINCVNDGNDLEDFRPYATPLGQVGIAVSFLGQFPFQDMKPNNRITFYETYCQYLELDTSLIVLYLAPGPAGVSGLGGLDLSALKGKIFTTKWFDPLRGGAFQKGNKPGFDTIFVSLNTAAAQHTDYGLPPGITDGKLWVPGIDWVLVLTNVNYKPNGVLPKEPSRTLSAAGLSIVGNSLRYTALAPARVCISLYTAGGAKVKTVFQGMASAGTHTVSLDKTMLSSGIYFVAMEQGRARYTAKFIQTR
jgi:hypothetical protein